MASATASVQEIGTEVGLAHSLFRRVGIRVVWPPRNIIQDRPNAVDSLQQLRQARRQADGQIHAQEGQDSRRVNSADRSRGRSDDM